MSRNALRWVWLAIALCLITSAAFSFLRVERWELALTNTPLVGGMILLFAAVMNVVVFVRGGRTPPN